MMTDAYQPWPPDWTPRMIHVCGEFAIGDDPHPDGMVDIPCYMNGACLACRHPFRRRRPHVRMREEVKPSFPFSFERARCSCGWRGPWRIDTYDGHDLSTVPTGNDTPTMDSIWHGILWRSERTAGETGMVLLVNLGVIPRELV
jgi:hypothetical protein